MKKLVLIGLAILFSGCASTGLTIAKCDKYENGICVNAQSETLKECIEPLIQDGKTYCK